MEIERKWLFDSMIAPEDIKPIYEVYYRQAYLSIDPEFRIRARKDTKEDFITYKLCMKSKGKLSRAEVQKDLTFDEFKDLMLIGNIKEEDFIKKHYFAYMLDNHKLTIGETDIGKPTSFIYGEIEFDSEKEAKEFKVPSWFGREVTYDDSYKMANYYKRTRNK